MQLDLELITIINYCDKLINGKGVGRIEYSGATRRLQRGAAVVLYCLLCNGLQTESSAFKQKTSRAASNSPLSYVISA